MCETQKYFMDQKYAKAIRRSIESHEKTYCIYAALSRKPISSSLQQFFSQRALEELKIKHILEVFLQSKNFFEAKVYVENTTAHASQAVTCLNLHHGFHDIHHCFSFLMHLEQKSAEKYKHILSQLRDADLRDLFHYLYNKEIDHEWELRRRYYEYIDEGGLEDELSEFHREIGVS